jgi:hypothetical protein
LVFSVSLNCLFFITPLVFSSGMWL